MPPCGYRPVAVDGLEAFLVDNLNYFVDLYRGRGMSVAQALESEAAEIERIRSGARGGQWAARAVEMNDLFYATLRKAEPKSWSDVDQMGRQIISNAIAELQALLIPAKSIAAE